MAERKGDQQMTHTPSPPSGELLPCPFCGKPAQRYMDTKIGCKDSDCAGFLLSATPDEWNRRADDSRLAAAEGDVRRWGDSYAGWCAKMIAAGYKSFGHLDEPLDALLAAKEQAESRLRERDEDAERYRWLREPQDHVAVTVEDENEHGFTNTHYSLVREELDAEIDAFIKRDG